jgi:hypothetical protein
MEDQICFHASLRSWHTFCSCLHVVVVVVVVVVIVPQNVENSPLSVVFFHAAKRDLCESCLSVYPFLFPGSWLFGIAWLGF